MHIKRTGQSRATLAAWHLMVCHQFTCKIGWVIYALKCVKHETNADAASNCFSKLWQGSEHSITGICRGMYRAELCMVEYRLMVK